MIANKILNVMTKIGPIIKDKTNEEKGFDYASLAAIIIKAREAMIEEKIIMIPLKTEQIVQRGNDITISMVYRFYDAEQNETGNNEYLDVNVPGEGCDKYSSNDDNENTGDGNSVNNQGVLNENNIEKLFGDPDIEDYNSIFDLGNKAG